MFARDGQNFAYTEQEKKDFREHPEKLLELRRTIDHVYVRVSFRYFPCLPDSSIGSIRSSQPSTKTPQNKQDSEKW